MKRCNSGVPASPFAPVVPLFLEPADSRLFGYLNECHDLIKTTPSLIDAVEKDLDVHALAKKAIRIADAQWRTDKTSELPGIPMEIRDTKAPLALSQGRPRTSGYVVLIFLLLRGFSGAGFKSADVSCAMTESITLRVFFTNLGVKMPAKSTLTELVNAVSNETRLLVLDAQVARALDMGLDDFRTFLQDSTHVEGSTAWPTDSNLMVSIATRLLRLIDRLQHIGLSPIRCDSIRKALEDLIRLHREIELSKGRKDGKGVLRKNYKKMLRLTKKIEAFLGPKVEKLHKEAQTLDVLPSRQEVARRVVSRLREDLEALRKVRLACNSRVFEEKKVPISEKVLSISDPDVGFISKGQRDPVIGYKPQIAQSGAGFITGLHLPQGNASDSKALIPLVDEVIARAHVTPAVVSVDDGYASAENKAELESRNIEVISINGSKGKALTASEDWASDVFGEARDKRSAVESLMYTLKQGFDFGEVARRGLPGVYAELLEKALAYNLCLSARLRRENANAMDAEPMQVPA